jgi:Flp pilus assembly protein TadG
MLKIKIRKRKVSSNNSGSVAIETAFILPIMIFLVFSIFEFGLIMYTRAAVNAATAEIGRLQMIGTGNNLSDLEQEAKKAKSKKVEVPFDQAVAASDEAAPTEEAKAKKAAKKSA